MLAKRPSESPSTGFKDLYSREEQANFGKWYASGFFDDDRQVTYINSDAMCAGMRISKVVLQLGGRLTDMIDRSQTHSCWGWSSYTFLLCLTPFPCALESQHRTGGSGLHLE